MTIRRSSHDTTSLWPTDDDDLEAAVLAQALLDTCLVGLAGPEEIEEEEAIPPTQRSPIGLRLTVTERPVTVTLEEPAPITLSPASITRASAAGEWEDEAITGRVFKVA